MIGILRVGPYRYPKYSWRIRPVNFFLENFSIRWYNGGMGIIRRWHGTEPEKAMRWRLAEGEIVRSFGGAFAARRTPVGGVLEKCLAAKTWESRYKTLDDYIASLKETVKPKG